MEQELVVRPADPSLWRHVTRYVGYTERTATPRRMREPPLPGSCLIFGLGPKLKVLDPAKPGRPAVRLGSFFGGPDDRCAVVDDGEMRGVEVELTPLAARMIFRESMQALARRTVALENRGASPPNRQVGLEQPLLDPGTNDSTSSRRCSANGWTRRSRRHPMSTRRGGA